MNTAAWIVAGLLAVAFLASGAVKLVLPKGKLATTPGGRWTEDFSAGAIKGIGTLEVLAAVGVALLMVGAMITHARRHEAKVIPANLAYLALAGFVAWARFGPHSFTG